MFLAGYFLCAVSLSVASMRAGRSSTLIVGDAIGYYAWLRSPVIDGDLDFRNDYRLLFAPDSAPDLDKVTPRGAVANKYPVGLALVEVPGFVVGHVTALATGQRADGLAVPYQLGVTLWLQLVFVAGAWLLWRALLNLRVAPFIAAVVIVTALCATNVVHYVAKDSAMVHGPGVAVLSAALFITTLPHGANRWRWAGAGALLGLAVIMRASNVAFIPFFLVLLREATTTRAQRIQLATGAVVVVALQVALASWFNGRLAFASYAGESFTGGLAGVVGTLTSARHGLFVYHPWYLVLVALCGIATTRHRSRATAIAALTSLAILALTNGTWWNWWFGDSFGNRAFIESIPILLVPVALWLDDLEPRLQRTATMTVAAAGLVFSMANAVLWSGFLLRRYPANGEHTIAQAYLWMRTPKNP